MFDPSSLALLLAISTLCAPGSKVETFRFELELELELELDISYILFLDNKLKTYKNIQNNYNKV
jgi:hypothetical protein